MSSWDIYGGVATALVELAYIPQLFTLWRAKAADEINVLFPMLNVTGRLMGIAYLLHKDVPIFALGVCVGITLRAAFLAQTAYYKLRQRRLARLRQEMVTI